MRNQKNNFSELIVIAPTQIKPHLSIGNIYDLTIADFYCKARKFGGIEISLPFLWNMNGEPLIKQMTKIGISITSENIKDFISSSVKNIENECIEHFLDFDFHVRDDLITSKLKELLETRYKNIYLAENTYVTECDFCKNIFGSDISILNCKFCGGKNVIRLRETLFKKINKSKVLNQVNLIKFTPASIKVELANFINKLPSEYNLIVEKNRKYTISYKTFNLDPRFTAIILPAIISAEKYDIKTWIHGDVVKKFDYYSLCYLNSEDCPTQIVAHGVLKGNDNKKIRWQNATDISSLINLMDKKMLRAYFLRLNLVQDIKLDPREIEKSVKNLVKIYVKIGRTLESRNLKEDKHGIREELLIQLDFFNRYVKNFQFHLAFNAMKCYADICWKFVKNDKMSIEEHDNLRILRIMFFGK